MVAEKQAVAPFTYAQWVQADGALTPYTSPLWLADYGPWAKTVEFGYMDEDAGKWVTVATYPATTEGLKKFNQEAPRLIKERKAELHKAIDTVERTIGGMTYTVYADPSQHGYEKAVKDAERVGLELLVAAGDRTVQMEDGRWVGGFTDAAKGLIVAGEGGTTVDHEVMHGYLAADHDFRNKLVKGMQTKGRKAAWDQAVERAYTRWGGYYKSYYEKNGVAPATAELYTRYAVACEVLCEARAGATKIDVDVGIPVMKKLIPYVQRETAKWEAKWDAKEHKGKVELRTEPAFDELIEMMAEQSGEDFEFDDGHISNYDSYDLSDAYEPADEYDSDGEELSKGQARYFAKSKIRNRAGELMKMFHGTDQYGFTIFDPEASDDGISMFFSDSPSVAASYSGTRAVRSAVRKPATRADWEAMSDTELVEAFNEGANGTARLNHYSPNRARILVEQYKTRFNNTVLAANLANKTFETLFASTPKGQQARYRKVLDNLLKVYNDFLDAKSREDMRHAADLFDGILFGYENVIYNRDFARSVFSAGLNPYKIGDAMRFIADAEKAMAEGDGSLFRAPDGNRVFTREMMIDSLETAFYGEAGNYPVYLYAENPLVIEADGANWYDIPLPEDIADEFTEIYGDEDGERCTRNLAEFAKNHGYDALVIHDLEDTGKYGMEDEEATIAVVFGSTQVKDAYNFDPTKDPDIRYNLPENADPMYSKLMKEIIKYKGNKLGAASIVPMLRGKGVKAEEIKWSGIESFLEGKKSVTKDELMTFLRDNALVIDTEVLSGSKLGNEYVNPDTGETYTDLDEVTDLAQQLAADMGYDPDDLMVEDNVWRDGGFTRYTYYVHRPSERVPLVRFSATDDPDYPYVDDET
ncbi:MAG: hypothetical protein IKL97_05420, partial [Eggerthellaceae bacterium]|nr:hypothetical protein [Eggerthellaceae bacterium]